jgi:hypothetical protein
LDQPVLERQCRQWSSPDDFPKSSIERLLDLSNLLTFEVFSQRGIKKGLSKHFLDQKM